jgi:hypothetical protein
MPGVSSSGEGQIAEPELLHLPQPLEERMIDDPLLAVVHWNGPMDRVADAHDVA